MSANLPAPSPREPQLDGLRCLAFLAVFFLHARPDLVPWGWGGVQFFFALSGFLITRILIRGTTGRVGADLRRYYYRRTLRIFPLYYAVVALAWLAGDLRDGDVGWFLTFSYNVRGFWQSGIDETMGHFWTLCVEEQFYLLYPVALLLTPPRLRGGLLIALIAGTVGFQVYAEGHCNIRAARILLPYCGEDLLWGALVGLIDLKLPRGRHEGTVCVLIAPPLLVAAWRLHEHRWPLGVGVQDVGSVSLYGIAGALLVFGASRCTARWIVGPLAWGPLAYLGRISYGLYAFHMPVLRGWLDRVPFSFLIPRPWGALALTVALAAASWHFFEGPINRLKDRGDAGRSVVAGGGRRGSRRWRRSSGDGWRAG